MKRAHLLIALFTMAIVGCGTKESYDKPDPAPKNNQFDTQASWPDATSGTSTKGKTDQAATDN